MSGKSHHKVVMGAMTFGEEGHLHARLTTLDEVAAVLDVFQNYGHEEVDTARVYTGGTSEEYLAKVHWQERGLVMHTKLYPNARNELSKGLPPNKVITHTAEDVKKHFEASLKALNADRIELFYLHGPDRQVPYAETLKAVDDLYKEGKFNKFGLSNYHAWEVAEICMLCRQNGWIQPTVYQGLYNAMYRAVERELIPCLRKFGLSLYVFNPLGGGFLTGRYKDMKAKAEPTSRFDDSTMPGRLSRKRYFSENKFAALDMINKAAEEQGLTLGETALRWLNWHSQIKPELGDCIIIGASSTKHLEENLANLEKGPLPDNVVEAVEEAWKIIGGDNFVYWH